MPNVDKTVAPVFLDTGFENTIEGLTAFEGSTDAEESGPSDAADRDLLGSDDALIQSSVVATETPVSEGDGSDENGSVVFTYEVLGNLESFSAIDSPAVVEAQAEMVRVEAAPEHGSNELRPSTDLTGKSVEAPVTQSNDTIVISVTTNTELHGAIKELTKTGGGTIYVETNDNVYGINQYKTGSDDGLIRILPADPDNPPTFYQVSLSSCKNFSIEGMNFDSSDHYKDRSGHVDDVNIMSSTGISIIGNTFESVAEGFYDGEGEGRRGEDLGTIRSSSDVVFADNTVAGYFHGLALINTTGVQYTGNQTSGLQGDPLRMTGVVDTLIEGNSFLAVLGSTQEINHSDMIQVWAADYTEQTTENLVIRGNYFNSSGGPATQTIFILNELHDEGGEDFRNIVIENNTIINGHVNGVTVYYADGVEVHNNTLLWNPNAVMKTAASSNGQTSEPGIRLYDVSEANVTGNITENIYALGARVEDNALINYETPSADGYYQKHFVNLGGDVALRDVMLLVDSPWAGVVGSSQVQPDGTPQAEAGEAMAVMRQLTHVGHADLITYDASLSYGEEGYLSEEDARFLWRFEDGTELEGVTVTRRFDSYGEKAVTLLVETTDGARDVLTRSVTLVDDLLLSIDFETGVMDHSSFVSEMRAYGEDGLSEGVFHLDGDNGVVIDRDNAQFANLQTFTLKLSMQLAAEGNDGVFLHRHKGMEGLVEADGSIVFSLATSEGWFTVRSDAGLLQDTGWHDIAVTFNGFDGGLKLYLDDALIGQYVEATGATQALHSYDLRLGNTWGRSIQAAVDDVSFRQAVEVPGAEAPVSETVQDAVSFIDGALMQGDLFAFDFDDAVITDVSGQNTATALHGAETLAGSPGDGYLDLGGDAGLQINRGAAHLKALESFTIGLSLKIEEAGNDGVFLHQHKGLTAEVLSDGSLSLGLATSEGWFTLITEGAGITDTDWHRVLMSYDNNADQLQLYLDGNLAAVAEADGTAFLQSGSYHLNLGNTWNASLQAHMDDVAMSSMVFDSAMAEVDYAGLLV